MKQGWEVKKLGEVLQKTETVDPTKKPNLTFNYVDVSSVSNTTYTIDNYVEIYGKDAPSRARKLIKCGDVLFATVRPTLKRIAIVPNALNGDVCSTGYFVLRSKKECYNRFIYFYLQSDQFIDYIKTKEKGASYPAVTDGDVKSVELMIPPIVEQERIVGILDNAFAKIEALRANAQQNLQNTKDLFQASIDKAYAIPAESRSISSVAKVINGYAFSSNDFKPTNSVKSIKITNVGVGEFIEESDNYLPSEYADSLQDAQVSSGDIVIALTRTIISAGLKVAVVPDSYNGALVNQRVAALVSLQGVMSRGYLYNFLLTTRVKNYVLTHVNTLMQPNLSITDLKNMDVPYLPYEEQKVVASKIDALSKRCRAMEENYRQTITHCNDLKQALLTKAFNGEL